MEGEKMAEFKSIQKAAGVEKGLSAPLFDATNSKGERKTDEVVETLLGDKLIMVAKMNPIGVREITDSEKALMDDKAYFETEDRGAQNKEVVFEARSLGRKNILELEALFNYYHELTSQQNEKPWTSESGE